MRYQRFGALLIAGLLSATAVSTAVAAARFDHATPGPGAVVAASPDRVDLYTRRPTSLEPEATQAVVSDAHEQAANLGPATVDSADRRHFWVMLRPNLAPGRYIVAFKTMSDDFDRDGGDYAFYVGAPPTAAQHAADQALALTTLDNSDTLTGYARGLVEGGLGLIVLAPMLFFYLQRRHKRRTEGEQLDPQQVELP